MLFCAKECGVIGDIGFIVIIIANESGGPRNVMGQGEI